MSQDCESIVGSTAPNLGCRCIVRILKSWVETYLSYGSLADGPVLIPVRLQVKAYFVRKTSDHSVVGIFVAPSATFLATLVDEHLDPAECEYITAGMGGLIVSGETAAHWPRSVEAEETSGLEGAVFTQQWVNDLVTPTNRADWKSLKPATDALYRNFNRH